MELDEMIDKLRVRKKDTAAGAGQSIYGNGKIAGWVIEKEKPE